MYIQFFDFATPLYDEAVRLRDDILRKPLGLKFTVEYLASEYEDIHIGCYNDSRQLVGCLVLKIIDEQTLKMRQVAVAESMQKKGVGQLMVAASEDYARANGYTKMMLHAREVAVPFYEKLEYTKVGERFEEVNIPHFKMEKLF